MSLCRARKLDVPSFLAKSRRCSARPSNSASLTTTNTTKLTEPPSPPRITSSRQLRADARAAVLLSAADDQNNFWSWIISVPTLETSATTALDPKSILGLAIHNNPLEKNATIIIGAGDRLGPGSWDRIMQWVPSQPWLPMEFGCHRRSDLRF